MKTSFPGLAIFILVLVAPANAQSLQGCPVFPLSNVWNALVNTLPVHPNSANYVNRIGAASPAHADFGSGLYAGEPIGIPFVTVSGAQPKVPITFTYQDESDPGPYPIPPNAPIEGGSQSTGDRHVLVVDQTNCILYEVYSAYPQTDGSWQAGSGAIFNLNANNLRPSSWTSADAAGLPILPGLARYDEVAAGAIHHALRFTAPQTQRAFIWPARHQASSITDSTYPPMGQRFRLKASFDLSTFSPQSKVVLQALKDYGMFLADNGSSWYVSGAPDDRWDNNQLSELRRVTGSNFEAVDESALLSDPNSGQVAPVANLSLSPISVAPAAGSGAHQTFTFTFSDPNGWQDLNVVNILVNNALDGRQSCYLAYSRPSNILYLVADSGAALLPGMALNGSGVVSNSQCSVSGAGSSAAGAGTNLTLTLNVSFTSTFPGNKIVYLAAGSAAGTNSGWQELGTWAVPGAAFTSPAVSAAIPARGSGWTQSFSFTFTDSLGWQDLGVVNVLINNALDGRQACYIAYSRPANALYLVSDSGGALLPALILNGSGNTANSQCAISGVGSSATGAGNTMTLTINASFSSAFAGNKVVYLAARDSVQNNSGWQAMSSWTVP